MSLEPLWSQHGDPKSTFGSPRAASSAPQNPPRPSFSPPGSSKVPSRSPRSSKHLLQGILGSLFIDFGWQNAPNGPQNGGLEPLKPPYSFQKLVKKHIQSTPSLNAVNHMGAAVSRSELNPPHPASAGCQGVSDLKTKIHIYTLSP